MIGASVIAVAIDRVMIRAIMTGCGRSWLQLSMGVSSWEPGKDLERILREADAAMYEAKFLTSTHRLW